MLVESLFSEMNQQRLGAQVHSVYVTAFQIVNESIQDLLQTRHPGADPNQRHVKGELSNTLSTPLCLLLLHSLFLHYYILYYALLIITVFILCIA